MISTHILYFALLMPPNAPEAANPLLRVHLVHAFAGRTAIAICGDKTIKVEAGSSLTRKLSANKELILRADGSQIKVSWTDSNLKSMTADKVEISPSNEDDPISLRKPGTGDEPSPLTSRPAKRYRGVIEVTAEKGKLKVVDRVRLESYLRGVIAAEMPHESPVEALKAQAVTSRTFALKVRDRYKPKGIDLDDTSMSQMYLGLEAEHPETDFAVSDTAGIVLKHKGEMIMADFYDDCGGVTSPGDGEGDFPPAILDGPDDKSDYCAKGPNHQWKIELKATEIGKMLTKKDREKIGAVRSFEVVGRDISGRATKVAINGEDGSLEMRGADFRAMVGYDRLKSTLFKVTAAEETIKLEGRGYGHGHGFCQCGAVGMAGAPYNAKWKDILKRYFPGAEAAAFGEK